MKYYPKNRIKTNLYTRGDEFINPLTKEFYSGPYYKSFDGKSYIGKDPSHLPIIKLIPLTLINEEKPDEYEQYLYYEIDEAINESKFHRHYQLRDIDPYKPKFIPKSYYPQLTEEDYKYNTYIRYFSKKINIEQYIEIDEETYTKLFTRDKNWAWELYIPFKLEWAIKGDKILVEKINHKSVTLISRQFKFFGFKKYLNEDYTKFWQS